MSYDENTRIRKGDERGGGVGSFSYYNAAKYNSILWNFAMKKILNSCCIPQVIVVYSTMSFLLVQRASIIT